jgi:hypothetical protein
VIHRVRQKHLTVFKMTQLLKEKWKNFINTIGYIKVHENSSKLLLFEYDHVIQCIPAVAMQRLS